ncbi:MAG: pyruvate formate lyase family protein [Acidobacteriota bacterium]|nr:pyruvate formate lyase family protein [Acidobacteriota bacterium]
MLIADIAAPSRAVTKRVAALRDRAWTAEFGPCEDRGAMVRAAFDQHRALPRKLQIAHALAAVCEQAPVHIAPGELIVGCRTVSGYPEHEEAIARGSAEPGYMIADYGAVLNRGLLDLIDDCEWALSDLDETIPEHLPRIDTLRSMVVSCRAVMRLAERYAGELEAMAGKSGCPECAELARICRKVPALPAETFHEAVQSLWFTHLGIYLECENVAFSFGQMDQYLDPFFERDLEAGRTTREQALEIMQCLWIKIYENVRGGLGHVQTVTCAGQTPEGADGVNGVTELIRDATRELMNVGPSVAFRYSEKMSDEFLESVLELMHDGRYMPQIYNAEIMVPAIASKGVPVEHARQYGLIGCHEPTICGMGYFRSASWPGYVCFQDWLERALGNGRKLDSGAQAGIETGDPAGFASFEDLWDAFSAQMREGVRQAVIAANRGEIVKRELTPRPFLSALIRGCVEKGMDFTEGGALYNMSGFQAFGIGTCADSLAAIRKFVYEDQRLTLPELVEILRANWEGHEDLRAEIVRETPHYGNDIDAVDALAVRMVQELENEVAKYRNTRGGPFILGLWSFWNHVYQGQHVAASADGRHHGEMMSHSMDPMMGQGLAGPTGAIRSAAKIDTSRLANGGSLLLEFQPRLLKSSEGMAALKSLVRTYFQMGGIQLQLSAVDAATLEAAMEDPDRFRHLVVRVAGYCDYFTRQDPERQAYIIAREKFEAM